MLQEFKAFVNQGNAIDLAVGVVIGAAFGKNDMVMPIVSLGLGRLDFQNMFIPLAGQTTKVLEEAKKAGAVIAYGAFINSVVEFFIVAFSIFLVVRQINKWRGPVAKKA